MKRIWILLALAAALCGCGQREVFSTSGEDTTVAVSSAQDAADEGQADENSAEAEAEETPIPADLCVYICGAVARPGVYELPPGSRVYAAVQAAGGLLDEADARSLNQAGLLEDGQQITVYTTEEIEAGTAPAAGDVPNAGTGSADGSAVNLNTADRDALMTLPGIGESRADAIISHREENGGFAAIEDIMQIEGIGEKSFAKLRDLITV